MNEDHFLNTVKPRNFDFCTLNNFRLFIRNVFGLLLRFILIIISNALECNDHITT